jgi:CO/xanthine dehydrogenase FAD-binding subunit
MKDVMYFAPAGIDEALALLAEHKGKATVLAGGTDLVPKVNYYELKPDILIYTGGMGSAYIKEEDGKLVIGAGTTWTELTASSLVAEKAGILVEAAKQGGCVATRNAGTIGGNLANASPAADLATPLLAMDAELLLKSSNGDRVVPIKEFFTGPGETVLKPDELLVEIHIPPVKGKTAFLKLGRRKAMTLSVVNVAVRLEMAKKRPGTFRTCNEARIALGAMAPTPLRCTKAEKILKGKVLDKASMNECAAKAIAETIPVDDQRATAWYRKKAGAALVARALSQAAGIKS